MGFVFYVVIFIFIFFCIDLSLKASDFNVNDTAEIYCANSQNWYVCEIKKIEKNKNVLLIEYNDKLEWIYPSNNEYFRLQTQNENVIPFSRRLQQNDSENKEPELPDNHTLHTQNSLNMKIP